MFRNFARSYAAIFFCILTYILAIPLSVYAQSAQGYAARCAAFDLADVYLQVERGVAKVITEIDVETKDNPQALVTRQMSGSAVYRGSGEFITNDHVVNPDIWKNRRVFIETDDGKKYTATVLWNDSVHDLAKISISQNLNLPILPFGNSKLMRIADQVFSVGYQFGLKNFTLGNISALDVKITQRLMLLDITFNGGTSGGATFTCDGIIIGINVARGPGLGFIIPSDMVRQVESHMDKFKTASFGSLGLTYMAMRSADSAELEKFGIPPGTIDVGMLVTQIKPKSAAEKSGLQPGDIITWVDDIQLIEQYQFSRKIFYSRPGDTVYLTIRKQNGKEARIPAKLDKADDEIVKAITAQMNFPDRE